MTVMEKPDPPRCPACGEERMVERIGRFFTCDVCSKTWPAEKVKPADLW